jgi:exonuclease VII small subunit
MSDKSGTYEKNFAILEKITESLNRDEIGIDDLVSRTKEALDAARACMEILKKQRGEFKKLEKEFSRLMENSDEESEHPLNEDDRLVEPD